MLKCIQHRPTARPQAKTVTINESFRLLIQLSECTDTRNPFFISSFTPCPCPSLFISSPIGLRSAFPNPSTQTVSPPKALGLCVSESGPVICGRRLAVSGHQGAVSAARATSRGSSIAWPVAPRRARSPSKYICLAVSRDH